MAQIDSDVVVIGGGIAGVSIGYELASDCAVTLQEAEPTLAYHTTGRSAATFLETFGDIDIRALTTAGRDFLTTPPDCFHSPLMTPGPQLTYAAPGNEAELEEHYREVVSLVPAVELVSAADIALLQAGGAADALRARGRAVCGVGPSTTPTNSPYSTPRAACIPTAGRPAFARRSRPTRDCACGAMTCRQVRCRWRWCWPPRTRPA